MNRLLSIGLACMLIVGTMACESESKYASVQIWLTDAPGDFEMARVEIMGVDVHRAEGDQTSGWLPLNMQPGLYDLLKLTNGKDTLLGSMQLPAGRLSQIRLNLSNRNSVKVGGENFALKVPSGYQSGIKILVNQAIQEGVTYKILLDFDVARSVVEEGNGSYTLRPVIRTITESQNGAIKGLINPADARPAVFAISGIDTVASTYADPAGKFLLKGLTTGNYTVGFSPKSSFTEKSIENVKVTIGNVTDIGAVTMEQ